MSLVIEQLTPPGAEIAIERRTLAESSFQHRDTISYIIATIDRPTLARTLDSIELRPGDEILIARAATPSGCFGHPERNFTMPFARCAWIAHIDDDDWYLPGTRDVFARAIKELPGRRDVPMIFRMQYEADPSLILWREDEDDPARPGRPHFRNGNVGTPMFLTPNIPEMLHHFEPGLGGDFSFWNNARWPRRLFVFRPEIAVMVGRH